MKRILLLILIGLGVGSFSASARAQLTGGLFGDVTAKRGGRAVAGARIVVRSPSLMGEENAESDARGRFRITLLPPGVYRLRTSAPGFAPLSLDGIVIEIGKTIRANVSLARRARSAPTHGTRREKGRPAGTLIVLDKTENEALLLDPDTGRHRARLPTGAGPHEGAVAPDGRLLVVCNYGSWPGGGSSLTVIDVPKARVVRTISLGHHRFPHGVAWLPGGKRVVVTVEGSGAVAVVDVEKGAVVREIETGQKVSHMVALAPNGRRAYVASIRSGNLTALDLEQGRVLGVIPTGAGAEGVDITPDGREVWVSNRSANTVSVVDTSSLRVVATLRSPSFPIRVKFTPTGRHALVSNARSGDLSVFEVGSRRLVKRVSFHARSVGSGARLDKPPVPIGILVRPDGRFLYVANANAGRVAVVDATTWKVVRYLKAGKRPDGLAWSPLGAGR